MFKLYGYKQCQSCRLAEKWLNQHHVPYESIPIRDTPPSRTELSRMANLYGGIKPLVNTSGQAYRKLNLKEQWGVKTDGQWLDLLASNGHLVKRPFLVGTHTLKVGFNPDEWSDLLNRL